MSVYNLCYRLQSLLYYCYAKTSSSSVQKRHSKVYGNPITPSFYSISPCTVPCSDMNSDFLDSMFFIEFIYETNSKEQEKQEN